MAKETGGPAFPQTMVDLGRGPESPDSYGMGGMSLRDWFAGQALAGILACPDTVGTYESLVHEAFFYADTMIKERSK